MLTHWQERRGEDPHRKGQEEREQESSRNRGGERDAGVKMKGKEKEKEGGLQKREVVKEESRDREK